MGEAQPTFTSHCPKKEKHFNFLPKQLLKKTYINNVKNVASFSRKTQTNVVEFSAIKLIYDKKEYISS